MPLNSKTKTTTGKYVSYKCYNSAEQKAIRAAKKATIVVVRGACMVIGCEQISYWGYQKCKNAKNPSVSPTKRGVVTLTMVKRHLRCIFRTEDALRKFFKDDDIDWIVHNVHEVVCASIHLHKLTYGNTYLQNKRTHNIKHTKIELTIIDYLGIEESGEEWEV